MKSPDDSDVIPQQVRAADLKSLVAHAGEIESVWRKNLQWGDRVVVSTRNSVYILCVLNDGEFAVQGGWFDRKDAPEPIPRHRRWQGEGEDEDEAVAQMAAARQPRREHNGAVVVGVAGCSWGGRAIHAEIIAAPGLFLEFDNGVVTTRIQRVQLWRYGSSEVPS